jgi:hypothetical protein
VLHQNKDTIELPGRRSWISVAASKVQLIIQLKKVGQSNGFPTTHQTGGNLSIFFASLGLDISLRHIDCHIDEICVWAKSP